MQRQRGLRRGLVGVASLAAAVVAVVAVVAVRTGTADRDAAPVVPPPTATPPGPTSSASPPARRPALGPDGVVAPAIVAENLRPGSGAWRLSGRSAHHIEGWASANYVVSGDLVRLYVSTRARSFRVQAFRMGWYGGAGARLVWTSPDVPGHLQPRCPVTPVVNMVSCAGWRQSLTMSVSADFVQGDYLLKLVGSGNEQSYVPLTVWDPTSTATYLFMSRSLTEQGWNTYGGYSFYQGTVPGPGCYPDCNRARIVSFDRPYATGNGASDFLTNEYPLLSFMERRGLDVAYCTDITVDEHPGIVVRHRAVLSLDHDETWTYGERRAVENAAHRGVNVAFFGAAAIVRHARLQRSPIGPGREEVDYRDAEEDPLHRTGDRWHVTANTWADAPTHWPTTGFVGQRYSGFLYPDADLVPLVVHDPAPWLFRGTGLRAGSVIPGVIGSDFDHLDWTDSTPARLQVLGHSPIPTAVAYTTLGSWGSTTYSDMTYYTDPVGRAGIFDSGTVTFIYALSRCPDRAHDCPAPVIGRMTGNLLRLFGRGPAGQFSPSVTNWREVRPIGS